MILRARVVLPIHRPPLGDGAVEIRGNRIAAVGRWRDLRPGGRAQALDLGEVVLMPGLVNAHCHLDYTHMAGEIPPPKSFTEWLKVIVSTKAGWSLADYEASWRDGAQMLLRTGTTTVADIEAVPDLLPMMWTSTPLRVFSFLELLGITQRRPPPVLLNEALTAARRLKHNANRVGLSPHAPYSTLPELLRLTSKASKRHGYLLATHAAESAGEYEMFRRARGEMYEWLRRSGRDMADCGSVSPVGHLDRCGVLGKRTIAAHLNYLQRGDAQLLANRGASVVHCPRSHFYFRHGPFPLRRLKRAGVNICLGTDSLASIYRKRGERVELSMFAEMAALADRESSLSPIRIVQMATVHGARALHLQNLAGLLRPGAFADLIAIPVSNPGGDLYDSLVHYTGPVAANMIGGAWAVPAATA